MIEFYKKMWYGVSMTKTINRAYKYRFYPTQAQEHLMRQTFGCVRFVYNRGLDIKSRAWSTESKNVSQVELSRQLTQWKKEQETSWLSDVPSQVLQQSLRNLESAYSNFFKKRAKYPRFKKRNGKQTARFTNQSVRFKDGQVYLPKMSEPLNIVWSRPLPENYTLNSVTVSLDKSGRWFVSFSLTEEIEELPQRTERVGVDLGITSLVTLSTGEKIANQKFEQKDRKRLAKAQRRLSKKQKGSKNRDKARNKVARIYARMADRRIDTLHKITTRLVRENQTIAIEDLNVAGMTKNHNLARAISDASFGEFRRQLEYKSDWYGRDLIVVDRFFPSSKTCHECGSYREKMPLNIREWTCPDCGTNHDRDVNAAKNILAAGLAVSVCGDKVRPKECAPSGHIPMANVDEAESLYSDNRNPHPEGRG